MRIVSVHDMVELVGRVGMKTFFLELIDQMKKDFSRWEEFHKSPRHAVHYPYGIIELMPIANDDFYTFKYVNGHPENSKHHKLTVVATGQLSNAKTGYPFLFTEMTLLTAIRTAATSALASLYLSPKNEKKFGIIGTGAQSEFQTLAHYFALGTDDIYYFDKDPEAMKKYAKNLASYPLSLHPCKNIQEVVDNVNIITTATAQKGHQKILAADWIREGTHINKIGGDSPGKTELDPLLVSKCKIVVEFFDQTKDEGEIQQLSSQSIHAELWQLIKGEKRGRESQSEITLFDSVGFALEDYSILRLVDALATKHNVGQKIDMIPQIDDTKNLFGLFKTE
jgi:ornithine cyclodeaminase